MLVSVIICTYRRYELLRLAVESLARQTAPKETFEVLIIENDTIKSEEIVKLVAEYCEALNIKNKHEPGIGLSNARNRGIREAKGDYLWFLDDDAKANPAYIENLIKILAEQQPDACGGPYYPFYITQKPEWFKEEYGSQTYKGCPRYLTGNETLMGGNMVLRKDFFDDYGYFNNAYGMSGNKVYYGEETLLQLNARKAKSNLKFYYDNDLSILHFVSPVKMKLADRTKRAFNLGHSHVFWDDSNSGKLILLRNVFIISVKIIFDISVKMFLRDRDNFKYWQNYYYEVTARRFGALGNNIYKLTHNDGRR